MNAHTPVGALAIDARALDRLKVEARDAPERAVKEVARQFEVLFMNMLLKSMRDALPQDGQFSSEQTQFYTAMLDQQLAQSMSARGMGLADVMVRQLQQSRAEEPSAAVSHPVAAPATEGPIRGAVDGEPRPAVAPAPLSNVAPSAGLPQQARDFVNRMWPHAVEAGKATGLPPHFIIGQAALESGWGRREIRGADGAPSYNLFGIKATRGWSGASVSAVTTEYSGSEPRRMIERFRAYDSYADAFRDYANLLRGSPRYAGVLNAHGDPAAFARGLQQAGYATDPAYADKLMRIINGSLLRQGLAA